MNRVLFVCHGDSLKKYLVKALEEQFRNLNDKISGAENKVSDVVRKVEKLDLETCKNFLVRCLADFEKGTKLSDVEKQRFWEEYEHYLDNKGNTYIKEWTERLKKEGKI